VTPYSLEGCEQHFYTLDDCIFSKEDNPNLKMEVEISSETSVIICAATSVYLSEDNTSKFSTVAQTARTQPQL
jgi:hypothetical protein